MTGLPERDRDAAGRARNARPRDALGRPMPRGATPPPGLPRIPEDFTLPPDQTLATAQRLLDDGYPFYAHEVLEAAWKAGPDSERDLWQGLAQLAVGITHIQRGNHRGARELLRRGANRIAGYQIDPPYRIDAPGLLRWAHELADRLERDPPPGEPTPPRLCRPAT
jgi:hypothetical protein